MKFCGTEPFTQELCNLKIIYLLDITIHIMDLVGCLFKTVNRQQIYHLSKAPNIKEKPLTDINNITKKYF